MVSPAAGIAPPSDDKRWKMVDATMRRHGYVANALIETLHKVQELFGYLEPDFLRYVARSLRVPLSKVFGVATFYHFFTMRPPGEHTCVVCTGTACYIKGAGDILAAIEEAYGVKPGQTTGDGKVSVLAARCLGSCGLAPAVTFDGEMAARVTPASAIERIGKWVKS